MNQTNFDMIELDNNYSTTRRVIKADPQEIAGLVKQANKPEDKFETVLFLPEGEARQGEGGLRTQGYFKVGGIIPSPLTPNASPLTEDTSPLTPNASPLTEDTSPLTPNPSPEAKPLITVVTVVFNGEKFLEETILSVINQTYDNVEYIIIDGGSTDGTLDIIKKYEHAIDYWVSEKDKGIYDAMNKGISLIANNYMCFIGSDDFLSSKSIIRDVFSKEFLDCDIYLFDVYRIAKGIYKTSIPNLIDLSDFFQFPLHHQGFLFKNNKLYFDDSLGIHSDLSQMYDVLKYNSISVKKLDLTLTSVRLEGITAIFRLKNYWSITSIYNKHYQMSTNSISVFWNKYKLFLRAVINDISR